MPVGLRGDIDGLLVLGLLVTVNACNFILFHAVVSSVRSSVSNVYPPAPSILFKMNGDDLTT